ncbi:MAG: IclR family transcriptional regulator [Rhodospirillaceae bacterium]|nr:IclR family transcriptional regulator [Rhodospirillaceae bacterium]
MKSVANVLSILRQFSHERPMLGVSEIGRALGIDKANVHRYLRTLVEHGFVRQDRATRRYALDFGIVELAGVQLGQMGLVDVARPHLTRLSLETQETVQLSVLRERGVFYVHVVESSQPIRVASRLGEYGPLHCTAAGKLLLAFEPEARRELVLSQPLAAFTPKTVTDPDLLRDELDSIRRRGFSMDDEGFVPHLRVVAAAVRDRSGEVLAAVAVGGPSPRVTKARMALLKERLFEATERISQALGYNQPTLAPRSGRVELALQHGRRRRTAAK